MTADEYFRSRNGGKSLQEMERDGEQLSPRWIMTLMKDYARRECKEQREICSKVGGISFDAHCRIQDSPEPEMD